MYEFIPTPKYSPQWWQEKKIGSTNILGFPEELFRAGVLTEHSWLIWADHGSENPSLLGCGATFFPTASDAVLWLRFHALPYTRRSIKASNEIAVVMEEIDKAPTGTDAEELLPRLIARIVGDHGRLEIRFVESIHDWLSGEGTVAQFRRTFKDQTIEVVDGKWSMAQPTWDLIWKRYEGNGLEGLYLPAIPRREWELRIDKSSQVKGRTLYLHVHCGQVWDGEDNRPPHDSGLCLPEYFESPAFRAADRIKVVGMRSNARLILAAFDLKQLGQLESVQAASPLVVPTKEERDDPEAVLDYLVRSVHGKLPPSAGVFFEVAEVDCRSYRLAEEMNEPRRVSIADENWWDPVSPQMRAALREHPAWKALSFIPSLNEDPVIHLLCRILDPRWFVDLSKPDSLGKLFSWLDLAPGAEAARSIDSVRACWKDERLEGEIRDQFESAAPVPVAGSTSPGFAPGDFVWRAWGKKLGLGGFDSKGSEVVVADLHASRRFVSYLHFTWLSVLQRESEGTPEQNAALFRPADFFEHPTEIAAYKHHFLLDEREKNDDDC